MGQPHIQTWPAFRCSRRAALITTVLFMICCGTTFGADSLDREVAFDIPAQPLSKALLQFGLQARVQIMLASRSADGQSSPAINGTLPANTALGTLLRGSGLSYQSKDNTVTVTPAATGVAAEQPFRLADAQQSDKDSSAGQEGPQVPAPKQGKSDDGKRDRVTLEEVVVTGTHIRGESNTTAPLQVITKEDIERSGYSTTQDLIRSIPQNFAGGALNATEDGQLGPGSLSALNTNFATGINLRGLGESSTLVLIDGHRLAPSDTGIVVDVSAIPLSAIERVEIMTDGASAIYGADAVAGVVNFILRKNYSGEETWVRYGAADGRTRQEQIAGQSLGRQWEGGNGFLSLQYQKLGALNAGARSFTSSAHLPTTLLPESHQYSALFNVHQGLPSGFDFGLDGLYSRRDDVASTSSSLYTSVTTPITEQGVASGTAGYRLGDAWRIEATGTYSKMHNRFRFELGGPPGSPYYPCPTPSPCFFFHLLDDFSLSSADLKLDGTLLALPGGDLRGAAGVSHESDRSTYRIFELANTTPFARDVTAEFAEIEIPLVGKANAVPLVSDLGVSLAVRRDDYSDFGRTTNPRYGLSWKPIQDLHLRGAYSKSFRAPNANEQTRSFRYPLSVGNELFASPTGGTVPTLVVSGQTGLLTAEKARSTNFGVDYEPSFLRNFALSLDYYDVRYADRIITPNPDPNALLTPDVYGPLITQLPSDAAAQSYLNTYLSQGATFFDVLGTGITGVRYAFNALQRNAAWVRQRGLDISSKYSWDVGLNRFQASLNGAYIYEIETAFTSGSKAIDTVNTYANPLRRRARAEVSWTRKRAEASAAVNYSGRYVNTAVPAYPPISPWTTVDIGFHYTPDFVQKLSLGLSVNNLFDRNPPYASDQGGGTPGIFYDIGNATPVGRLMLLDARLTW